MPLASLESLAELQRAIREACVQRGTLIGQRTWGWPGGSGTLPTYRMVSSQNSVLFGWKDDRPDRWWIGLHVSDSALQPTELVPTFEFNIPRSGSLARLAMQYEQVGPRIINARHTGRFTVTYAVAAAQFFSYCRSHPAPRPVISTSRGPRIDLFTFNLDSFSPLDFASFAETVGEFGEYVIRYKDFIREERENA